MRGCPRRCEDLVALSVFDTERPVAVAVEIQGNRGRVYPAGELEVVVAAGIVEYIQAIPAVKQVVVGPGATGQRIVAAPALQPVAIRQHPAEQFVVTGPAAQGVVTAATVEVVIARLPVQQVATGATVDPVTTVETIDCIVASARLDGVPGVAAGYQVVSPGARDAATEARQTDHLAIQQKQRLDTIDQTVHCPAREQQVTVAIKAHLGAAISRGQGLDCNTFHCGPNGDARTPGVAVIDCDQRPAVRFTCGRTGLERKQQITRVVLVEHVQAGALNERIGRIQGNPYIGPLVARQVKALGAVTGNHTQPVSAKNHLQVGGIDSAEHQGMHPFDVFNVIEAIAGFMQVTVVTGTAPQGIGIGATGQPVIATQAQQQVTAGAAIQLVVAMQGLRQHRTAVTISGQLGAEPGLVVIAIADQVVVAGLAMDDIVPEFSPDSIIPGTAVNDIVVLPDALRAVGKS